VAEAFDLELLADRLAGVLSRDQHVRSYVELIVLCMRMFGHESSVGVVNEDATISRKRRGR
jgi:hypothetical protein